MPKRHFINVDATEPGFETLDCSVYIGRERLGRYLRTGPQRIVAFDADDKQLGNFRKLKDACLAISAARREARVG